MVTHYPAPRPAGDHRASANANATLASAHNEALQILDYLEPDRQAAFIIWSLLVGNTDAPGLAVCVRDLAKRKPEARARFLAAQRGRAMAWSTRRRPRAGLADFVARAPHPPGRVEATIRCGDLGVR